MKIPRRLAFEFRHRASVRRIFAGFSAVLGVAAYGTIGFMLRGWSFSDALYMTVTTLSTVGYGEVRPIDTSSERLHVISLILLGIYSIAFTTAAFVQLMTEGEIQAILGTSRMRDKIDRLSDHAIIVGYGRVGAFVCEELGSAGRPFVVIEREPERTQDLERLDFNHIRGDATLEAVLIDAGIARARTLVTVLPSDANNVFVTLSARQLSPEIEIIARGEYPSTAKLLRQAGAKHVIMPAAIGAHRIAALLTRPKAVAFAEMVTRHSGLGLEMMEFDLFEGCPLVGRTLVESDIRRKTGTYVAAVRRPDGRVDVPVPREHCFSSTDHLVLVGSAGDLRRFRARFGSSEPEAAGDEAT